MQFILMLAVILPLLAPQQPTDVYRVGNGVSAPTVVSKVNPEYSEAARKERVQGTVLLESVISEDGVPKVARVVRGLGYGLDENAVAAFEQWRFKPATKDGKAVKVSMNVEMNFNIAGVADPNSQLPPLSRTPVTIVATDSSSPNTIYAATRTGLYKTMDGGATWKLSESFDNLAALAIDPRNPSTLYAGSLSGGTFRSVDSGANWTPVNHSPTRALLIDPSGAIYAATTQGISKSVNGGNSWTELLPGNSFARLTINPAFDNELLAVTEAGDLFRSTDRGASWQFIGGNIPNARIAPIASSSNRTVALLASDPIDDSLPAPRPISPDDGAIFNVYPRLTTVRWTSTSGAASYIVEWDYSSGGVWHLEGAKLPEFGAAVQGTEFSFDFVGAQPGRWRVWAVNAAGQRGKPSDWRTFNYTR